MRSIGLKLVATWIIFVAGLVGIVGSGPNPKEEPQITVQPADQSVPDGGSATFEVAAKSPDGSSLQYQWYRNQTAVSGATSLSFTTPAAALGDTGTYFSVVVRMASGAEVRSRNALLTVVPVAPTIVQQPAAASVVAGDAAIFAVTARGSAPIRYQWRRNGTAIVGATQASYTLLSAQASDDGASFDVLVSNVGGNAVSATAALTVTTLAVAPSLITHPADVTANIGQTARFTATADGTAPLTYQWQRNGVDIGGANSASFTTAPLEAADNGATYRVRVSNAAGSATSNVATLSVNAQLLPPTIVAQPVAASVVVGQTASFTVVADGSAPLTYQWQRAGTAIPGATSSTYITAPLGLADSGASYTVTVSNGTPVRVTSQPATLTVRPAAGAGPALNPADYVLAGAALQQTPLATTAYLSITDPAAVATPRTADQLAGQQFVGLAAPRSWARNSAGEMMAGPAPFAYVVQGGVLYKVDLKRTASRERQRLSAIDNACGILQALPLSSDASTAWIGVQRCSGSTPLVGLAYVRSDMTATDTPVAGPANFEFFPLLPSLIDPTTERVLHFLGTSPDGAFRLLSPDLRTVQLVSNSAGAASAGARMLGGDGTDRKAAYLRLGNTLRRLSWDGIGGQLSAPLYTFLGSFPLAQNYGASDASGFYFVDNNAYVLRVRGESPAVLVRAFTTAGVVGVKDVVIVGDQLVLQRGTSSAVAWGISAMSKAGDTLIDLTPNTFMPSKVILGTHSNRVVYASGASDKTLNLESVALDGSTTSIAARARIVATVANRAVEGPSLNPYVMGDNALTNIDYMEDFPVRRLEALVFCVPQVGRWDCAKADVFVHWVGTGVTTRVGTMTDSLTTLGFYRLRPLQGIALTFNIGTYEGLPTGFVSLVTGNGTVPTGEFISSGIWWDFFTLDAPVGSPLQRATRVSP